MSVQAVALSNSGFVPNTTGLGLNLSQQLPSFIQIETNDTLATVLSSTYLNKSKSDFQFPYTNQQMALVSTTDNGGQTQWLAVTVSGTNYGLAAPATADVVATPTVANQITYSTNTGGALASAGLATALFNAGNISAGKSGTAGILESYPSAATSGKLELVGVANGGDYAVAISNVSHGQATTLSFADVGSSVGRFLVANTATPFTNGNFPQNSGTAGLMVDSGVSVASIAATQATVAAGVQVATVTLNTAAVIAAYATPQVLIAAVAGKVIVVHSAVVYTASTGNTPFTTGVAPIIQYNTTVHGAGTIAVGTGLVTGDITTGTSQIRTIGNAASAVYTGITNVPVCFSCTTAYAAGTGTSVTFDLVYEYITATV